MSDTSTPAVIFKLLQLVMKTASNVEDEELMRVGWVITL